MSAPCRAANASNFSRCASHHCPKSLHVWWISKSALCFRAIAPKLLASCCSLARTNPRQNGSVFIRTFLHSHHFYGGVLEMRLLAHRIPTGDCQFVSGAVRVFIVPIAKVKRNKNVSGFDISNSRLRLNFAAPRDHLHEVPFRNPMVLGVCQRDLNEYLIGCGVQFSHSTCFCPCMPMIDHPAR